ncbi:hypothetical protein B9G69_002445 [Bdellovibrio sp. SKB1291214]|uniref:hypothetical protein n=1 Tax=Bdellovibrio sp. SKB1291214 TaxID=1732569 RepID=UPI00223F17AF|nr:hypothetical protein [Bdellovibrio sp. SKB1291214]UYL09432.1 hypothetical protein B9G69_002445 [Bdellovibrio sp. SKB1291214]
MKLPLFSKILFLIVSTSFTVAMAEDKVACLSQDSMQFAFQHFQFEDVDAHGNVIKTYSASDACEQGLFKATIDSIDYIRKVPQKTLPANFQTAVSKEGATNFLTKRIKTIQFEAQDSTNCDIGTVAFVFNREPIMHICPQAKKLKAMDFSAFLEHEARHTEGHPHVNCTQGVLKSYDGAACDDTYKQQGSYGIGLGFVLQVYFSTENEAVKQQARSAAIQDVLNRFNQLPLDMVKGGVFVDEEDSVSFYDGAHETKFGSMADEIATISFVSNIPYIFFKNGKVTSYDFTRNWNYREGALVDNYNKLSQQERNELLDVLSTSDDYCFLTPSRVQCLLETNNFAEFSFSALKPLNFVNVNQSYVSGIIVLANDGKSYKLPKSADFASASESNLQIDKTSYAYPEVTSYAEMANGRVLGISQKGFMMEKVKGSSKWIRAKEFGDYKFKKILPYKWSKRLESL